MFKRISKQVGLPPGSLVHVGEVKIERPVLGLITYDETNYQRLDDISLERCLKGVEQTGISWINLYGIHDIELLRRLGEGFSIHPLALEDILNTTHRPKVEIFDTFILVILKMISSDSQNDSLEFEQVSFILGENFLISFQERPGDFFNPIRERLQRANGRIRSRGTDYLLYALLDAIVDHYFHILENLDERLAQYEHELISETTSGMQQLHYFSKNILLLRKSLMPLREIVIQLQNDESERIHESTGVFLRDLQDHVIQVNDSVDSLRDTTTGLLSLHMSLAGNRMNEVMKVLTIMASIFIPLTFIAGIYGMNFENMPELKSEWGYPAVLILMAGCFVAMLIYFKRKRWL